MKRNKILHFICKLKLFDQRRYPRFRPVNCMYCSCVYTNSGKQIEFLAQIIDISQCGLLLKTGKTKIYPNTELMINFKLPDKNEVISIPCKVVRTYRIEPSVWYYSGVEHHDKNNKRIKILVDFAIQEH